MSPENPEEPPEYPHPPKGCYFTRNGRLLSIQEGYCYTKDGQRLSQAPEGFVYTQDGILAGPGDPRIAGLGDDYTEAIALHVRRWGAKTTLEKVVERMERDKFRHACSPRPR